MSQTEQPADGLTEHTAFQRDILYVMAGLDAPAGVDIKEQLDAAYPDGVMYSRLYQNLNDLVGMGLVEKGTKDDRTNEYTLTARARQDLRAHRDWREWMLEGGDD